MFLKTVFLSLRHHLVITSAKSPICHFSLGNKFDTACSQSRDRPLTCTWLPFPFAKKHGGGGGTRTSISQDNIQKYNR